MVTLLEKTEIRRHKKIVKDALKSLSALDIRSHNKAWNLDKANRKAQLSAQRTADNDAGNWGNFGAVTTTVTNSRLGNCWERGTVFAYFASLSVNDLGNTTFIYRVKAKGWDHVWAVLTTQRLTIGQRYGLDDLGTSGAIMDGWSEDWYFPNVGRLDTIKLNCWRAANPFQTWARAKVNKEGLRFKVQAECT